MPKELIEEDLLENETDKDLISGLRELALNETNEKEATQDEDGSTQDNSKNQHSLTSSNKENIAVEKDSLAITQQNTDSTKDNLMNQKSSNKENIAVEEDRLALEQNPQITETNIWNYAPSSIRQASTPIVADAIDPFASLNQKECSVLPHFMLIGEFCRHEILGRYVEAMNMSNFTWEQVRESLNTGASMRVLDHLRITSAGVIANCIDILIYRHTLAHPEEAELKNEQEAQRVVLMIRRALENDLINKLALEALYNAIQKAQTHSGRPKLALINWKAKIKRQPISVKERNEVLLFLGELANRLVINPFKVYLLETLGSGALDESEAGQEEMYSEIKLKKLETFAKNPSCSKVLEDLNVADSKQFGWFVSIVRKRNNVAHPKYWKEGSLKKSIQEIRMNFPTKQRHAVDALKNFIERLPYQC